MRQIRFVWRLAFLLAWCVPAHSHCAIRRADAANCVLDVTCYGGVSSALVPPPAICSGHPRIRLALRGARIPSSCPRFFADVLSLHATGARWTAIPAALFRCAPRLQILHLPGNPMGDPTQADIAGLPALRSLDLSAGSIAELDKDVFANSTRLERLFLARNHISSLNDGTFAALTALAYLDLSRNELVYLQAGNFRGLINLKVLRLDENNIVMLNGALQPLTSLEHLNLRGNKLLHVDVSEIAYSRLLTLDMTNNTLAYVQPQLFASLAAASAVSEPKARILLGRNKIAALENTSFVPAKTSQRHARLIRNNDVNEVRSESFTPTEIDLSYNMIEIVEYDAFSGIDRLVYLDLSSNRIAIFSVNATSLGYLQRLYLHSNRLMAVDPRTMFALGVATIVDLSRNKLERLPNSTCWAPGDITALSLADNSLKVLEAAPSCGTLERLSELDASRNALANVRLAGAKLPSLRRLKLRGNNVTALSDVRLHYLLELTDLDLGGNRIGKVPRAAFVSTPSLRRLNLASNAIASLEPGAFASLPKLGTLDLSDNELSALPYGALSGMGRLEELDLNGNHLVRLESRSLFDLQALSRLRLEDNELRELDVDAWKTRRAPLSLSVGGNKLSCAWVASALSDAREGWSGAKLMAGRARAVRRGGAVAGISCLDRDVDAPAALTDGRTAVVAVAVDDRLLLTNQKILEAIMSQTAEVKKALKAMFERMPLAKKPQREESSESNKIN